VTFRSRVAAAFLVAASPLLLAQLSREELEAAKRTLQAKEPSFEKVSEEELRRSVAVATSRNHAVFGYNTPEVTVRLPAIDNSAYAVVTFVDARPLDSAGRVVPHELEHGLHDPETHAIEIRFGAPAGAKGPIPLARAVGRVRVRYPVAIRTVRLTKPQARAAAVAIDGPYVTYAPEKHKVPDASLSPDVAPVRAYDAGGKRLEHYDSFSRSEVVAGVSRRTVAFWGRVLSLSLDAVDSWAELDIPFDLPPAPQLPPGREGLKP
jgi:hypothetical protein